MKHLYPLSLLLLLASAPAAGQLTVSGPGTTLYVTNDASLKAVGSISVNNDADLFLAGDDASIEAANLRVTMGAGLLMQGDRSMINGGTLQVTESGFLQMLGDNTVIDFQNIEVGTGGFLRLPGENSRLEAADELLIDEDGTVLSTASNPLLSTGDISIVDGGELSMTGGGQVFSFNNFNIEDGGVYKSRAYTEATDIDWNGRAIFYIAGDAGTNDFGRVYTENNIINVNGEIVTELINGYEPVDNQRYRLIDLDLQFTQSGFTTEAPNENWTYDREQNYVDVIFDATSLPVEWLGFTGQWTGKSAQLDWQTATEVGSDYFDVERQNEAGSWDAIGQVQAAGESLTPNSYDFLDADPGPTNPVLYRLRQVDFDGAFTYSDIVSLNRSATEGTVSLYPNPAKNHLFVEGLGAGEFTITDAAGREVARGRINDAYRFRIELPTNLAMGTYFLRSETGAAQRFTVAR